MKKYNKVFQIGFGYMGEPLHECIIHSDGAIHINLKTEIKDSEKYLIRARITDSNSLIELIMLADAIEDSQSFDNPFILDAFIPYFPYSRADRVVGNGGGDAFGLYQICSCIKDFFETIYTLDMHSDSGLETLVDTTNSTIHNRIPYEEFVKTFVEKYDIKDYCLVSPDAGAKNKVENLAVKLGVPVYELSKKRDQSQKGKIISYEPVNTYPGSENAIILDDICDGGGTFIMAASGIPRPANLYLGITHGIFSKGLNPLISAGFKGIITTDSFPQHKHDWNGLCVLGVDQCL